MNYLYLDANIYLGFYDSTSPNYKSLLQSLIEAKANIFVTQQISDEILRNKLGVFDGYLRLGQLKLSKVGLQDHLANTGDEELTNWNKETKKLELLVKVHDEKLKKIVEKLYDKVFNSEDEVSTYLSQVFHDNIKSPSEDDLKKARLRKECGNPPGKRSDPLGDQLSWEQLLSVLNAGDKVWIISKDKDYAAKYNGKIKLAPFLVNDLKKKNVHFFFFEKLADGIKSFNNENDKMLKSIPEEKQLKAIAEEEKKRVPVEEFTAHGYTGSSANPILLTTSGSTFSFGTSGIAGTSGTAGSYGTSGTSGSSGTSDSSGTSGSAGYWGTSGRGANIYLIPNAGFIQLDQDNTGDEEEKTDGETNDEGNEPME